MKTQVASRPAVLPARTRLPLPSAELGQLLDRMQHEQAEVDRRRAEQIARLRELADRD